MTTMKIITPVIFEDKEYGMLVFHSVFDSDKTYVFPTGSLTKISKVRLDTNFNGDKYLVYVYDKAGEITQLLKFPTSKFVMELMR